MAFRDNYLSKENSNCLKAIFAFLIIFSHLYSSRVFLPAIGPIVTAFGYLSVSGFLFFSGYGLTYSYQKKEYFNGYFKKRILPIYIINALLVFLYGIFKYLIKYDISPKQIVQSFLFGDTVVQFGWYIQMIMLFYIIYYFAFIKSLVKTGIIKLAIALVIYCFVCAVANMGQTWYESSFAFLIGAIWAYTKPIIDERLKNFKTYLFTLVISMVLFGVTFVLGNVKVLPSLLRIPTKMISAVVFIVLVMILVMRIKIDFKPIVFLGNYYFEVYFMQGFFIIAFNNVFRVNNNLLYCVICLVCTYAAAILVKPAVKLINDKCRGV